MRDETVRVGPYNGTFNERDMIERLRNREGSGEKRLELEVGENVFENRCYHDGGGAEDDTIKTEECFRTINFDSFNGRE